MIDQQVTQSGARRSRATKAGLLAVGVLGAAVAMPSPTASAEWKYAAGYGCNNIAWMARTDGRTPAADLKTFREAHEQESVGSEVWWLPPCASLVCNTAGGGAVLYANGNYGFQYSTSTNTGCGLWRSVSEPWGGAIDPMSATYRLKWKSDSTQQSWWTRDLSGL